MNSKNSSQDFAIKKEFIDLQLELKKFMDESELFTLQDILKDPLVIHSIDDYINAYEEAEEIKHIQKVLKKLLKYKKKNIQLTGAFGILQPEHTSNNKTENKATPELPNAFTFTGGFFSLKPVNIEREPTKERLLQTFKAQFKRIEALKKVQIPKQTVNRNFSVSTSHSQLMKKIERGDVSSSISPKNTTEITVNSGVRNGVIRNMNGLEKVSKVQASQANVVKAMRSPYQSSSGMNPHEALLSSTPRMPQPHKKNQDDNQSNPPA